MGEIGVRESAPVGPWPDPDLNPLAAASRRESIEKARSRLRLFPGWSIMGRILGRLKLEAVQKDSGAKRL